MMMSLRRTVLVFFSLSLLAVTACGTPPEERFALARAAAADKDLEKFASFFTRQSAGLLRDMTRAAQRSKIPYLKDPFSVLPEGDIEEVTLDGNAAVLKVKAKKKATEVRMFMENDEWSIDLYSLPGLWAPLKGGSQ